jgi:methylmalonyl-CoA mutase
MGVNTFLSSKGSPTVTPGEVIRATEQEKEYQIFMLEQLHKTREDSAEEALENLKESATKNRNIFNQLMETAKFCSIGQITGALFSVGGQYRRNM